MTAALAASLISRRVAPQAIARFQKPCPGADAAHARGEPAADCQRAVRLSDWMARLLRLLPNPVGIARA
jgi:hypothetical protein